MLIVPTSPDITSPAMRVSLLASISSDEGWLRGADDEERYVGRVGTEPIQ